MTKRTITLASVLLVLCSVALAQYTIPLGSINSGGASGTCTGYGLNATVGQTVQGMGTATGYAGYWGFWYCVGGKSHDVGVDLISSPADTVYLGAVTLTSRAKAYGEVAKDTCYVHFMVFDSIPVGIYHESAQVIIDSGGAVTHTFPSWTATVSGNYTALSYALDQYDNRRLNDSLLKPFFVGLTPPETGWTRKADVPGGSKNKAMKDGGCLAYDEHDSTTDAAFGYVYALKGNGRYEFYRYNIAANVWVAKESIPAIGRLGKKKAVKKGATMATALSKQYAAKGNGTVEWWCYNPDTTDYPWKQMTDVPAGAKACKEGCGAATVTAGDSTYIFFLKGSGTQEFYRYNVGTGVWATKAPAPLGTSGKAYKNGSALCASEDGKTLYAVKNAYNEFYAYMPDSDKWFTKTPLPLTGSSGKKKKVGAGGALAYHNSIVYAIKANNTSEFWKYKCDTFGGAIGWKQMPSVPSGSGKNVKAGGALAYGARPYPSLFLTKGNNTFDFFKYGLSSDDVFGADVATANQMGHSTALGGYTLSAAPNPFTKTTTIRFTLPAAGKVSLKLYDVTGSLVTVMATGHRDAGTYTLPTTATSLAKGIYVLKLETSNGNTTQKLIIE